MSLSVALRLGRVSNLPTVWSNSLAGIVLAGGDPRDPRSGFLLLAFTLFYLAGMFLNDAFDQKIDAVERPERPIPSGQISGNTVFAAGFAMLVAALAVLTLVGFRYTPGTGWLPLIAGLCLALTIILYDWQHKNNPLSPLLMGLCRMLVYVTAGFAIVASPPPILFIAAGVLLSYLIGLTYIAKQENLGEVKNAWPLVFLIAPLVYGAWWTNESGATLILVLGLAAWLAIALCLLVRRQPGDIRRAVICLIAGISLVDAIFIAGAGFTQLSFLAITAFILTLMFQRFVPGT